MQRRKNVLPDFAGMPDAALAQLVAAGDPDAFGHVMRRCNQALYRAARAILKNDAEAEDAVQDAYLLAYRGMAGFRSDAKLSTWLTRIVVNEALGRIRKRRRSASVISIASDVGPEDYRSGELMSDTSVERPEHAAMRAECRRLIEAKIDQLPEAFRVVFVLRALDELSVEEVAQCLNIPETTVRTRFFRARSLLREALSAEMDVALEEAFSFAGERCDRIVEAVLARVQW